MHIRDLPPLLRLRLLVPLVIVALTASACGAVVDETTVSVTGSELTRDDLEEELDAVSRNPDYLAAIEQQFGATAAGEGEGTWNSEFVARLLSLQTYYELLEQELDRRGVEVTDEELDGLREETAASVGGPETFEAFPASYQDTLVRRRALLGAVEAAFRADGMQEGDAEAFYEENLESFETRCMAHILVGRSDGPQPTGERTGEEAEARAQELYEQIQAGADFEELAASDVNDDTVSAAQAGDLGCITPTTSFDPVFLEAAFDAEVGEVTEPVETQFGYHLILVSSSEIPPFEEVQQEVEQVMAQRNAGMFNEFLIEATCERDIEVASRYGTWDTSQCTDGPGSGIGMVVPPTGPIPRPAPTVPLDVEVDDPAGPAGAGG